MPEFCDLYDRDENPLGEIHMRGKPVPKGKYFIVAVIWVTNGRGSFLQTKRHPRKHYPLMWECTGGLVTAGETPAQGALRELLEETGIVASADELVYLGRSYGETSINEHYVVKKDIPLSELHLQAAEVVDAKWVTPEEYEKMCVEKTVVPQSKRWYLEFDEALKKAEK